MTSPFGDGTILHDERGMGVKNGFDLATEDPDSHGSAGLDSFHKKQIVLC
jgi:hypothetical protein